MYSRSHAAVSLDIEAGCSVQAVPDILSWGTNFATLEQALRTILRKLPPVMRASMLLHDLLCGDGVCG